jgi:hypothetical protein
MKTIIVTIAFIVSSITCSSQVISFYIDTVYNFIHPIGMDAIEAFKKDSLNVTTSSISDKGPIKMVTDLNNKKVIFNGFEDKILTIEKTNLLYSITVNDNDWVCYEKLARTEDESQFIYIFEFEIDGMMDGFIWIGDKEDVYITK